MAAASAFQKAHGGEHPFEMRRKASFSKLTSSPVARSMSGLYGGGGATETADSKRLQPQKTKIFGLMPTYTPTDMRTIQQKIVNHVEYTLARTRFNFGEEDCYRAAAYSVRDRLIETLNDTNQFYFEKDVKRCYYLSLEFLIGRAMQNALVNLDIEQNYADALRDMGYALESLYEHEHDAALGNGGLGRLAACFLDSMATLNLPCMGYGIRYTYGIFEQKIVNGRQVEHPDYWLVQDNPWEIVRHDITYAVRFYGEVRTVQERGRTEHRWCGGQLVQAIAHDNPVPGFDTFNCINLRLWRAAPSREFDFKSFNQGRYLEAVAERQDAECISAVLYPNDDSEQGKVLRLKQQYFFCCATIQDVLRRFKLDKSHKWEDLPSKMAIQLNDTHPTVAIPEMLRVLLDIEKLDWDTAWGLTSKVFAYTNHTVLPEALEKWDADLFGKLLPRHLIIINEINARFLSHARSVVGDVYSKISRMSIYEEGWCKKLRMANLAVIGSHKVNGVAALHSELVRRDLFPEFVEFYGKIGQKGKFINITNGVTPRRWLHCANRELSNLLSEYLGSDEWLKHLDQLRGLEAHASDPRFIAEWQRVKLVNKRRLAAHLFNTVGIPVDPEKMLFDVQVKRIHEYKRQALNLFFMVRHYLDLKRMSPQDRAKNAVPRCTMVGGKAAPGYARAKTIIKMINNMSCIVNNDPETSQYFKVIYIPNYNVSQAQIIIPAADVNNQISTAGTEASGTGNMKFVMNGSLILGTLDGATVEIAQECGEDTVFLFGAREADVAGIRQRANDGRFALDGGLADVFAWIRAGHLAQGDGAAHGEFCAFVDALTANSCAGDFYLLCHDFPDYMRAQRDVERAYADQDLWTKKAIKAVSRMGFFSTDRTIREYASEIWGIVPAERQNPMVPKGALAPAKPAETPVKAAEAVKAIETAKAAEIPAKATAAPAAKAMAAPVASAPVAQPKPAAAAAGVPAAAPAPAAAATAAVATPGAPAAAEASKAAPGAGSSAPAPAAAATPAPTLPASQKAATPAAPAAKVAEPGSARSTAAVTPKAAPVNSGGNRRNHY